MKKFGASFLFRSQTRLAHNSENLSAFKIIDTSMRIGRTLPPAASPIPWKNIFKALTYCLSDSKKPIERFERELQSHFAVKHCHLVSSGKAALTLILQTLHELHPDRTEVLIPAYTCFSVPAAINKAGLKIRLCDIDINTLDFNQEMLKDIAEKNRQQPTLLAVMPTHLFGFPANIDICRKLFLGTVYIIEDAAQAMGVEFNGKKLGTMGDVGFFSLGRGKALSTIDGGIILTNQSKIGNILQKKIVKLQSPICLEKSTIFLETLLLAILQHPLFFWIPKSLPFLQLGKTTYPLDFSIKKYTNIQGVLSQNWEKTLQQLNKYRRRNAVYLAQKITANDTVVPLQSFRISGPLIRFPIILANAHQRKKIFEQSEIKGLGIMPGYPSPIHEIAEIKNIFQDQVYPSAKMLADGLATLPVHPFVTKKDIHSILSLFSS